MDGLPQNFVPPYNALPLVAALRDRGYRFTAVTPATHRLVNARAENSWAASTVDVFGWSRKFAGSVLDAELFAMAAEAGILEPVAGSAIPAWRSRLRAASLDGFVLLHSAFPTEAADAVFFGPDTYRFAAAVTAHLRGTRTVRRAIDVGCGTGAAGILIARAHPDAEVILADISGAAVALATCNAAAAGADRVICIRSDLFTGIEGGFDLIVANPPYLNDPLRRLYRHGGGALGAALSLRILQESLPRLAAGGTLLLYTGSAIVGGRDAVFEGASAILAGAGLKWHYRELDPDVFGEELRTQAYGRADRIAAVLLTVERPA
jgi:methylase of polypeptide subunit release factors